MPKEKRKKDTFDVFGFNEGDSFPKTDLFSGGGSGYSISVSYDDKGKPVVKAQTQGDVDVGQLRRDIEQRYPGARIEGLEKPALIRIIDEEKPLEDHGKKEKQKEAKTDKKEKKQTSIRIVE